MEEQEAYRILKLEYGAEPHKVKSAYRKMALKLHPDRNGSNTEFGKITNAYNVLKSIPAKPVKKQSSSPQSATRSQRTTRPQNPPEQDWSKYTKEYEQDESFWTEFFDWFCRDGFEYVVCICNFSKFCVATVAVWMKFQCHFTVC